MGTLASHFFPASPLSPSLRAPSRPCLPAGTGGKAGVGRRGEPKAGKKGLRGSFKGCAGEGRILMSQQIRLGVTLLLPEKRRPGQEAAGSAAAGVQGRSRRLSAPGGRGTGSGLAKPPGAGAARGGHA